MFRQMAKTKIDQITHHFLEYIDIHMPSDAKEQGTMKLDYHKDKINKKADSKDFKFGIFCNTQKGMRPYMSEFDKLGIQADIPRQFYTSQSVVRTIWQSYDDYSTHYYSPEIAVGGIITFEAFKWPELPSKQLKWTMRVVLDQKEILNRIPFPDPQLIQNTDVRIDPVKIVFPIPNYVYISNRDDIKVGMWDMENHKWRIGSEFVENIGIDSNNNLSFGITKYAPYAMLQSRCTDYPYQEWKLRSISEDKALLTIKTKRMELVFEIGEDYVKLIE